MRHENPNEEAGMNSNGRALEFHRKCGFERAGKTEPMWIYEGHDR
jgi:hypothetical protein